MAWWLGMMAAAGPDGAVQPDTAEPATEPWARTGLGFGGLPAVNYNSDEGLGFGVVGSVYKYDGSTGPYKTAINGVLFTTTKAIHTHSIEVDALELGGKPVRATVRAEFAATKTSNYCGLGPEVTCDPTIAEAAAVAQGLEGEAYDDAVRRYYRTRFLNPNAQVNVRWAFDPMPHRVELIVGWRGNAMIPGDFQERTPFPGSLYAEDFPGGESEFVSALQVGLMADNRDNEPAPTRGYWVEATLRGATAVFGSTVDFFGFNTTLRGYVPVGTERLVWANRVVFDGLVGDAPTVELTMPGGTQRYVFYGSLNAGRGIRLRHYIGALKAMHQSELRWTFLSPTIAGIDVDLGVLAFTDVGFVGETLSDVGDAFSHPLPSTGGGLRIAFDKNFVIRVDVGVSPIEGYAPAVYVDLRNLF